jgi:hypothetical protein
MACSELFDTIDRDGSGGLDEQEVAQLAALLTRNYPELELQGGPFDLQVRGQVLESGLTSVPGWLGWAGLGHAGWLVAGWIGWLVD